MAMFQRHPTGSKLIFSKLQTRFPKRTCIFYSDDQFKFIKPMFYLSGCSCGRTKPLPVSSKGTISLEFLVLSFFFSLFFVFVLFCFFRRIPKALSDLTDACSSDWRFVLKAHAPPIWREQTAQSLRLQVAKIQAN